MHVSVPQTVVSSAHPFLMTNMSKTQGTQEEFERSSEEIRLAQHAFEEDHQIVWNQAKIPQTGTKCVHRKYKKVV